MDRFGSRSIRRHLDQAGGRRHFRGAAFGGWLAQVPAGYIAIFHEFASVLGQLKLALSPIRGEFAFPVSFGSPA